MSREAFLKSTQPADPEPESKRADAPSGLSSPAFARSSPTVPSRSFGTDDKPAGFSAGKFDQPSFTPIEKNDFHGAEPAANARLGSAPRETVSIESITIESISIETIAKKTAPANHSPIIDAESVELHPATDTARIEAQLNDLLNDDFHALRDVSEKPTSEAIVAKRPEAEKPSAAVADPADAADPFAFDLGPSPFAKTAAKPEPELKLELEPELKSEPAPKPEDKPEPKLELNAEPKLELDEPIVEAKAEPMVEVALPEPLIETKVEAEAKVEEVRPPEAAPVPLSPISPVEPPRGAAPMAYAAGHETPLNGTANGSHAVHAFESTKDSAIKEPEVKQPEPSALTPAPKPRQTFAVPSVSATLGPSRKLEPLSDAFRPNYGLSRQEPPLPMAEVAPEPSRPVEPQRPEFVQAHPVPPPAPPVSPAASAPALRSEPASSASQPPALSSELSSGDRPMEDAVADLLRPLLKTWLAENMPKILERALRREMSERLLPGQKNPRE